MVDAWSLGPALVLDAGVIGALRAEKIPVEVGKPIMQAFDTFEEIPMPEPTAATGTDARLCADDADGQDVIAGVPELPILALAGLFAGRVGDAVGAAAGSRDGVEASSVRCGDLLEATRGEGEGAKFAGVAVGVVRWVRYPCGVHSDSSFLWAVLREAATSPGLFCLCTR
jgi:hypothetical protein